MRNSAHVTLEEFTAYLNDEPADTALWAHLSACALCDTEMRRWRAVAGGIREAAPHASRPAPVQPLYNVLAAVNAEPPAARPVRPARRRPLLLAVGTAAVVTAILGIGALATNVDGNRQEPPLTGDQTLTALVSTDCAGLKVAAGALESVSASKLVLRTADGKTVTVMISGSSKIVQQVAGSRADITDGVSVMARGQGSQAGDQITATQVAILPKVTKLPNMPGADRLRNNMTQMMASLGHAMGTVSDVNGGGFTVTGSNGAKVKVVTSASTSVVKPQDATVGDLKTGKYTVVVGVPNNDGTLTAKNIDQNTLVDGPVPPLLQGLSNGPAGGWFRGSRPPGVPPRDLMPSGFPRGLSGRMFNGLGCDADAISNSAIHGVAM